MKKLAFSIQIAASQERVWQILWEDATYRAWAATFYEGSYAESDWQEGSKILFLSPGGDGMSSRIAQKIDYEYMSFEHLGEVKNGVEEFGQSWAGAQENYTLYVIAGGTELSVELDTEDDFADYFTGAFPKALARVKELAEGS